MPTLLARTEVHGRRRSSEPPHDALALSVSDQHLVLHRIAIEAHQRPSLRLDVSPDWPHGVARDLNVETSMAQGFPLGRFGSI
eukprot:CAMPEP_0182525576 /NCGR_PEP_ID=MMETSP1323-20130603/2579_1 /TAXON_ID=236787 /ORGANISM="Florenciella parvula, Strain RCC1693" /LENGTH=82 /DNA_ID=CAMNT_0024734303 /DNA_START=20 /DNA_END=268 /DNA_ORIENTATION=+